MRFIVMKTLFVIFSVFGVSLKHGVQSYPQAIPIVGVYWRRCGVKNFWMLKVGAHKWAVMTLVGTLSNQRVLPSVVREAILFRFGAVFEHETAFGDTQHMFNLAIDSYNDRGSKNVFDLDHEQMRLTVMSQKLDVWSVKVKLCSMLERGLFVLNGASKLETNPLYQSITDSLHIPKVDWNLPHGEGEPMIGVSMAISLYNVLADLIISFAWNQAAFIYTENESLAHLEKLLAILYNKTGVHFPVETFFLERPSSPYAQLREFHNAHQKGAQHIILYIRSSHDLKSVLKSLAIEASRIRHFHYVVASPDICKSEIDRFHKGLINITFLRTLPRESGYFQGFLKAHNMSDISPEGAIAYDSVKIVIKALYSMLDENDRLLDGYFRHGQVHVGTQKGFLCGGKGLNQSHARLLAKHMQNVKHSGLSGWIEFDKNGFRKNFSVEIVSLVMMDESNVLEMDHVLNYRWEDQKGFQSIERSVAEHIVQNQLTHEKLLASRTRRKIRIVTVLNEPFVMLRPNKNLTGNDRFEGYCVDLIKLIAKSHPGFDYEIHLVRDSAYGAVAPNGRWDGMIGEVLEGDADMIVASLTITKARERVIDFSKPYLSLGISIMIKKPDKHEFSVFSFTSPLSLEIWMYILLAYLGVSLILFLVSRFSPYEWRIDETPTGGYTISNDFSIYNCMWFSLAAFMQQGTDIVPRSMSGRMATSAWWFFTLIILSSYTANLASFLTLEKMSLDINDVYDLAKQTKIKYGIQAGGSTAEFFRESTVEVYRRMWQFMSANPDVFTKSYAEGIQKVRESKGRYAFLLESTAIEYQNMRRPCDTMKIGNELNSVGYGIATPFGSELKDLVNLAILDLQEHGELLKLKYKWWYDKGECEQGKSDGHSQSLSLSKVAGIFYILIAGMVVSMVVGLMEFFYQSKVNGNKRLGAPANSVQKTTSTKPASKINEGFSHRKRTASLSPAAEEEGNNLDGKYQSAFNTAV